MLWLKELISQDDDVQLHSQMMPSNNGWISKPQEQGFVQGTWHQLLWFYAQSQYEAASLLPSTFGVEHIQLRRFPQITPAALDVRHLALIHVLSAGSMPFAQIEMLVASEHRPYLCPDLAALSMLGAIKSMPNALACYG